MRSKIKKSGIMIGMLLLAILLTACGENAPNKKEDNTTNDGARQAELFDGENPIATITMEDGGEIDIELYPAIAPNTVHNFISLAEQGFYDGLIFHRVIPGFMIQGGDPDGDGTGGPGYAIKGEFTNNGFKNDLKHDRGVISMARSQSADSAGSQFFIVVADSAHLDKVYASFGQVISGMDVVDEIVKVETAVQDKPVEDQRIKTITIDKKENDFPEPETN